MYHEQRRNRRFNFNSYRDIPYPIVEGGYSGKAGGDYTTGLRNWWKFDESSGNAIDSVGGATGVLVNGPTWAPAGGQIGGAILCDASDDGDDTNDPHLDLGTGFSFPSTFTVSVWVKPTNYNDFRSFIGKRTTGSAQGEFQFDLDASSGEVKWVTSADGDSYGTNVTAGVWTHLAIVGSPTENRLYVNGVLARTMGDAVLGTAPAGSHANICNQGEVDSHGGAGGWDGDPFKGYLDDMRIYSRALSGAEIEALYSGTQSCTNPNGAQGTMIYSGGTRHVLQFCNGRNWIAMGPSPGSGGAGCSNPAGAEGKIIYNSASNVMQYCDGTNWRAVGGGRVTSDPMLTAGLVGWWKLDESAGNAADSAGTNTGTRNGTTTWEPTGGRVNGDLSFDGSTGYVSIANESNFDFDSTNAFSIAAWVYRNNNTTEDDFVAKVTNTGKGYSLGGLASFDAMFWQISNVWGSDWMNVAAPMSSGAWHHVVATYDGALGRSASSMHLYIDGVDGTVVTSDALSATSILSNQPLLLGVDNTGSGSYALGKLDDVRFYNRALTPGEVRRLYQTTGGQ